jgi:hypothetical protein
MKKSLPCLIVLLFLVSSCAKLQEDHIENKKWLVNALYVNGDESHNALLDFLPLYKEDGTCRYEMDFQANEKCVGYYKRNDSLIYQAEGTWRMLKKDWMMISVDLAVHGDYYFKAQGGGKYRLHSENNELRLPDLEPIPAVVTLKTSTFK